jgi:hypothetical protein
MINNLTSYFKPDGTPTPEAIRLFRKINSDIAAGGGGGGGGASWGTITGTLSAQTDLQSALNARQPLATVLTNTTAAFTTAQETKLSGIATGATANATDAALRDRATHTGTQAASTITGLATVATSGAYADLSGIPSLFNGAYSSLSGIPSTFAPSAHTHPLSDLTQSGATTGQVAAWNGSAWAPATVSGGGGATWAIRILNATQTMANDTTVQDWFSTAGGLLLDANSTYEFEGNFISLNGTTSHGLNMQFAAIAGASIQWNAIGSKGVLATEQTALRMVGPVTFATNRLVTTANTVGGNRVRVWGTIRTTTAGTLIPRVAQSAASGSFVVQPGTYFKARRIGANTLTNSGEWT